MCCLSWNPSRGCWQSTAAKRACTVKNARRFYLLGPEKRITKPRDAIVRPFARTSALADHHLSAWRKGRARGAPRRLPACLDLSTQTAPYSDQVKVVIALS